MKKIDKRNVPFIARWKRGVVMTMLSSMAIAGTSYGQALVDEDFSGQTLPAGWSNVDNGSSGQIWQFNNPHPRNISGGNPGFDADFAILDSDNYGSGGDQDASLESPAFNASVTATYILSFDNQMRECCGAEGDVDVWNGTSWTTVLSLTSSDGYSNPANHKVIDITSAVGSSTSAKIRFHYTGSWDYWWAIDNVTVSMYTCYHPGELTASNITSSSASCSWTPPNVLPANGYEYYYSTANTPPTAATTVSGSVAAGDTSVDLTGLNANTQYYVWVRSICSATDTSEWSDMATFTTLCETISAFPWTEDFDTLSSVGSNIFPNCWSKENGHWATTSSTTYNVPYSGDNYLRDNYQADGDYMWTPGFQLTGGTLYAFSFYMQGDGYTDPDWQVGVYWNTDQSSSGATQFGNDFAPSGPGSYTYGSSPYEKKTFFFTPPSTGSYYFGIAVTSDYTPEYVAFDDFSLDVAPSCIYPFNLTASNVTTNAADLSWDTSVTSPGNGYEYYYSTSAATPSASANPSGSTTDTAASLTGLTPNTQYYVWVRSACSSSDQSDWSPAVSFTTECLTSTIPYVAPLANVSTPNVPECMSTELINTNGTAWYTEYYPGNGFTGNTLVSDYTYSGDGEVDSWVYTNALTLTGGTLYKVSYRYGNNSTYYTEKLQVSYGTSPAASDMTTELADYTDISDAMPHDTEAYFVPSASGIYYIGFRAHSDEDQDELYLDGIKVDAVPPCNEPNSLLVSNISPTSAHLSWYGASDNYTLEYGPAGFTQGTGTVIYTTSGAYTLSGLDPNTSYDFYVRSVCVPGYDSSSFSQVQQFTTLCDTPAVALGNDTAFCVGGTIILDAGTGGTTYAWNTGSAAQTLTVNASGTYSVRVTNDFGCSNSDSITVTVNPYPVVNLGADTVICEGNTLTLDAGNPGSTYSWNNAAVTQTIQVTSGGTYAVTVNRNGCVDRDTIQVTEHPAPVVLGITAVQASDGGYDYTPMGAANVTSYSWDFGDGTPPSNDPHPHHIYSQTGIYTITLIVSNDCGSDTITAILQYGITGISQITLGADQLKLYPNPAKDLVTIKNTSVYRMEQVTVYNMLGQVVFEGTPQDAHQYQLHLSGYASGIYSVRIKMNEGFVMRKFEVLK